MAHAPALPVQTDKSAHVPMMALDEWMRAYDRQPFELVDGEKLPLTANVARHGNRSRALFRVLDAHITQHQLGEIFFEVPFVSLYQRRWVKGSRTPDLLFYATTRFAQYTASDPEWEDKPFAIVPDLAIEVASPTDRYTHLQAKVLRYLQDGVQLVWVVQPKQRIIAVYQHGSNLVQLLGADDTLTGGTVLPGFSVKIGDIL